MNLPGMALEFLDAFRPAFAALRKSGGEEVERVYSTMPLVHVHCFTRELEEDGARKDILQVRLPDAAIGAILSIFYSGRKWRWGAQLKRIS